MMQSSLPSKTIKNSKKKATDTSHKKSAYGLVTPFVIFFIVTILI
ncbi:TPA: sugar ABC transporter permease, partial [Enterococcus faecium]